MKEWKKVKLGEICEITSSKRIFYSEYVEKGVPFYRSKEIIELSQGQSISEPLYISENRYNEIKDKFGVPQANDILLTSVGSIGIPYIVNSKDRFYFKDGNLTWLHNYDPSVAPLYILYWIKSDEGFNLLNNIALGAAQKALTIAKLKEVELSLPPLPTQHRIASILSRYDALIENYQKQIKLLEEAAARLYKQWFVELKFPGYQNTTIIDGVPEGWEKKKINDLVDVQYGYAFDGKLFNSSQEGTPIIRIRNIPDGYTNDYTTEEAADNYIVKNGDILVGMDGIFHINTWSGGDGYLVQRACSFRPKNRLWKGFLLNAIVEPIKFFEKTLVGATVAHLGKKHIDSIELLCPNSDELLIPFQKFFDKRQLALSQIRHLTEARDRLLPKLMSGELEV